MSLYLVALLLVNCKEQKRDVIDLSDILPTADETNNDINELATNNSTSILINSFSSNGIEVSAVFEIEAAKFPDRFGPSNSVKYELVIDTDTVNYYRWVYKDSLKVMNAFYNWIDCFGEKCKSIFIGEQKNFQMNALQIFVNDSSLIFIENKNKVDYELWTAFHDSLGYSREWNYVIEQNRRGKATWFTYLDEKKINLEK